MLSVWMCGVDAVPAFTDTRRPAWTNPCLAIGDQLPRLILDPAPCLAALLRSIGGMPFRGTVARIDAGRLDDDRQQAVQLGGLDGAATAVLEPGDTELEGYRVRVRALPAGGRTAVGRRITDPGSGRSVAYLPRHGPLAAGPGPLGLGAYHHDAVELAYGADLLIHGARYADAEVVEAAARGHCTVGYAVGLARRCRVGRLVLIHRPNRPQAEIAALTPDGIAGIPVSAAREGQRFDVDPTPGPGHPRDVIDS